MTVRIRLTASCLADPSGIKFRGYEVDVPEEQAAVMVSIGQWEYVGGPPPKAAPPPAPPATAAEVSPEPAVRADQDVWKRRTKEFRKRGSK